MKIFIDIDKTIAESPVIDGKLAYDKATPISENIEKANALYDLGHEITYYSARGAISGIDWTKTTKSQFEKWGIKYHHIRLDKPAYDVFIDDKNMNTKDWTETSVLEFLNLSE